METGTAAAVFPRLKTLLLEIYSYQDTAPELPLVYYMQSVSTKKPKICRLAVEEGRTENVPSHTEVQNSGVI